MKTAAIICEYDPFHNGHAYLIRKAKKELGFDFVVCIMSGNFVQRGAPAICDKYLRAKWALYGGADMVLEIPPLFAASSAPEFAACAIRIAEAAGIVDALIFGVEDGITIEELKEEACRSICDSEIRKNIRDGMTYPEALSATSPNVKQFSSNNILAIEYLKAMKVTGSSFDLIPVSRIGDKFSSLLPSDPSFVSATSIRQLICSGKMIDPYVPSFVLSDHFIPVTPDALTPYLNKALLTESDLSVFCDVSREISGRLEAGKNRILNFSDRVAGTKTKQYTYTRISRALLHIALGMRKDEFQKEKNEGYIKYLRILGMKKNTPVTSLLKEKAVLPLVGRTAQFEAILGKSIFYDQLYYSLTGSKGEYERSPVVLDTDDIG